MPGYEWFGKEERAQVNQVLDTGILFRYEFEKERKGIFKVREFEEEFARYCGAGHAQATTSGSTALRVALAALGIGHGDEVITQGFTFIATFEAILEAGAVPVPAEIDRTLNLDPADFERKITDRTRAVMPVHMLGAPARVREIVEIAKDRGIKVIEDTAQAVGAAIAGKKLGSFGDMGTFSFDFYKTVTCGEGGMVITDDRELWVRASEYADHGHDHNPNVHRGLEGRTILGFNYRMNELQGAVGLAQLGRLDRVLRHQKRIHDALRQTLESIDGITMRELPPEGEDSCTHVCFFLETADKAVAFQKKLGEKGVPAIYFKGNFWHYLPNWEHLLAQKTAWPGPHPFGGPLCARDMVYKSDMLPASDAILEKLVVIPVLLQTDDARIAEISGSLRAVAQEVL
ncbi:MAG: DegT/DnrJ/EryC1/StrS family aminotransferase [Desulfomonile sp.]|nr:DegT/DnrJ/EryC1/StrS family aminotransferase [Desulfomonile sp.]